MNINKDIKSLLSSKKEELEVGLEAASIKSKQCLVELDIAVNEKKEIQKAIKKIDRLLDKIDQE